MKNLKHTKKEIQEYKKIQRIIKEAVLDVAKFVKKDLKSSPRISF